MTTIKTATGKEVSVGYFIHSTERNMLTIGVKEKTPTEVNDLFCDPEETCRIEYADKVYEGYTYFQNIEIHLDSVRVRLVNKNAN